VRIIVGSRRPLRQELGDTVSEELFYCLRQNFIQVPPLRERAEDILDWIDYFLARRMGDSFEGLEWVPRARTALEHYSWPGNLNELNATAIEIAGNLGERRLVESEDLPPHILRVEAEPEPPSSSPSSEPGPPPAPEEGFRCDGYRMIRLLARTASSRVFLAELESFPGQYVVVKFGQLKNKEQIVALKETMALSGSREGAKHMVPIHHANISVMGSWYMVVLACLDDITHGQEFRPSLYKPRTFRDQIEDFRRLRAPTPKDRSQALEDFKTILDVLEFFHKNKLVINDVKPENFGLYQGSLVVIDYGGVTFRGEWPHESTPGYGPPEEEGRSGQPAEDVFAVVQMLGEAFYGFDVGELRPDNVSALAEPYLKEGTLFDKLLWTVLAKGLHTQAPIRYQHAKELHAALTDLQKKIRDSER
jgi:hypothetical protein